MEPVLSGHPATPVGDRSIKVWVYFGKRYDWLVHANNRVTKYLPLELQNFLSTVID